MTRELGSAISPDVVIHSQLVLPTRDVVLPELADDCEGLWACVNRICDQYMPQLFDSKVWRIVGDNVDR
jgi:hypothetical protein